MSEAILKIIDTLEEMYRDQDIYKDIDELWDEAAEIFYSGDY